MSRIRSLLLYGALALAPLAPASAAGPDELKKQLDKIQSAGDKKYIWVEQRILHCCACALFRSDHRQRSGVGIGVSVSG